MANAEEFNIPSDTLNVLIAADGAFQHILDTYNNIFPEIINEPKGKAKLAPFEEMDLDLYRPDPTVVFRIGPNPDSHRMMRWLKALWVFYKYMKTRNYTIEWENDPKNWTPPQALKSICIIVKPIQQKQGYRLFFYVTTGTVMAQGKRFQEFADDHFPCIKYLFEGIPDDVDDGDDDVDDVMDDVDDLVNALRRTNIVNE